MVRQYIGARYVPKFYENSDGTAEWRSGVIYEPLTIVTWNGNSYTSKKDVPAEIGDPSANGAYWAPTGLYNTQVEEIRQRMEEIYTEVEGQLDDFQEELDSFEQTEIVWIGDSYTQANSLGADQAQRYSTLVSEALGLTEHNYATGGSDFISGGPTGENYITQLNNAVNGMTADEKRATKYVIAAGTRNMPYNNPNASLSDYFNAISHFFDVAHTEFPDSQLVFIPMLWDAQPFIASYRTCIQWCEQCALSLGYPVITIWDAYTWLLGRYGDLLPDTHPNVSGHRLIANHVYNAIKGNNIPAPTIFTNLAPASGVDGTCQIIVNGKTARIRFSFTVSGTISGGGVVFNELQLGNNYGFVTNMSWTVPVTSNTGSGGALQLNNYYTGGSIRFGAKAMSSLSAGTYTGEITLYNGMSV